MKRYKNYLMDMDGVLVRGRTVIPGAQRFIDTLNASEIEFLVLTNNPFYTPRDLAHRLQTIGLEVPEERIFTSPLATARFLNSQLPHGKAFVIGESGLTDAIHSIGYIITDQEPDYVVLGETHGYNFAQITKADAPDRRRRALCGHQPRSVRTRRRRSGTGLRRDGRAHRKGQRRRALLRRQAQPAHDPHGPQLPGRPLGRDRHDRRPHGHRHRGRRLQRAGHGSGAHRRHQARRYQALSLPADLCAGFDCRDEIPN